MIGQSFEIKKRELTPIPKKGFHFASIRLHVYDPELHNYRPQRSWGKVIFSEACVKNSVRGGVCGRGRVWQGDVHGRGACVVGRGPCMAGVGACIRSISGRYASYWNAFLFFVIFIIIIILILNKWVLHCFHFIFLGKEWRLKFWWSWRFAGSSQVSCRQCYFVYSILVLNYLRTIIIAGFFMLMRWRYEMSSSNKPICDVNCSAIEDEHEWLQLQCVSLFMEVTMENIQASGL